MGELSQSERSLIIVAKVEVVYYVFNKFLRIETIIRQKRLVSKIEAKFGTLTPGKIQGGMSEMSERILQVWPTIEPLVYTFDGASVGRQGDRAWVSRKKGTEAKHVLGLLTIVRAALS